MRFSELLKEKYTMAFIGGSITEGTSGHCFLDVLKTELPQKYSQTEFDFVNAGVGGTDSMLGLFRLERDVLKYNPDMIFIEFAVNDGGNKLSGICIENMIRRIKKYNEKCNIVLLYTATSGMMNEYLKGKTPNTVATHMKLSEYYGIHQINLGVSLNEKAVSENREFAEFLADGVHPTKEGYDSYGYIILDELEKADFKNITRTNYLFEREIENPRLVPGTELANEQWHKSYNDMYGRLPDYIYSYNKGEEISFNFKGSILGIYYTIEKDSGILEYCIDNGEWKEFSTWDEYALRFNRACATVFTDSLEDKVHSVTVRNPMKKDEKSEGYYIRIGAFMIG